MVDTVGNVSKRIHYLVPKARAIIDVREYLYEAGKQHESLYTSLGFELIEITEELKQLKAKAHSFTLPDLKVIK